MREDIAVYALFLSQLYWRLVVSRNALDNAQFIIPFRQTLPETKLYSWVSYSEKNPNMCMLRAYTGEINPHPHWFKSYAVCLLSHFSGFFY